MLYFARSLYIIRSLQLSIFVQKTTKMNIFRKKSREYFLITLKISNFAVQFQKK